MMQTDRLLLRQWQPADLDPLARMNANSDVMRFFPSVVPEQRSHQLAHTWQQQLCEQGWGLWAVESRGDKAFIGFVGLNRVVAAIPHAPFLELVWRLLPEYWGRGYAPEAAAAALDVAFAALAEEAVYAMTALINQPSIRVMEKLGMGNTGEVFDHPAVAAGHVLQQHCLYRMRQTMWLSRTRPLD